MISRLTHQKGLDLIDENIESIMELDAQWIFLGTGDNHYENKLIEWAKRWPEKIAVSIAYSSEQAHQLFAGSDLFLMPSIFEPCGQSQIYSMRYGTIPLAHAVGGLVDTIKSYPKRGSTGFLFQPFTSDAFMSAIQYAINTFHQPRRWKPLMKRAMRSDFSVRKMAEGYLDVYQGLIDTMD
jgi:starch synthase